MKIIELKKKNGNSYSFKVERNGQIGTIKIDASSEQEARDKILARPEPDLLAEAKAKKIKVVKNQANTLIEKDYPKYKQINYALGLQVNGYDNATNKANMESYIKSIIEKSELMESEINALTTEQEVKDYKINLGSL